MTTAQAPPGAALPLVPAAPPPVVPAAGWYADPSGQPGQRYWDGAQWAAPAPPAARTTGTNGMAVASLVLSLLWLYGLGSLLAVIFGAIGRKQIATSGQGGGGLATAGLVIGIIGLVVAVVVIAVVASASDPTYSTY